ncbi:MAG: hypothetical protein P8127_06305 [Acidobacteriota bacterium]
MSHDENTHKIVDLRPLIARLKEVERKCGSMGSRNEEFPLMKERLSSIIARLEAGEEPSGERLAFRAIARELFPVAHLFESVGFTSVGKEINHVERALQDLEPQSDAGASTDSLDALSATSSAAAQTPIAESDSSKDTYGEQADAKKRESVPIPVVVAVISLVVVMAIATALVLEIGPFAKQPISELVPPPPTVAPSPLPKPSPTTSIVKERATPSTPSERLADALSSSRQSLETGDLDGAVKYLSIATLIDRNSQAVQKAARDMVRHLVAEADAAASERRWEDAARCLDQARGVAVRFDLNTGPIDRADVRYAEMRRYRIVQPEETDTLRESIGKRVDVQLGNGSVLAARITDLTGSTLVLDVEDDVGGGVVRFVEEVALSDIDWVRIWVD